VIVHSGQGRVLHDRDLVTAIDGMAPGGAGRSWRVPAYRPGERLTYLVVRDGRPREVTVTLVAGGRRRVGHARAPGVVPARAADGEALLPAGWLGFSGLPLLAGLTVAVLRYRLFDLDRVVSRTVADALLTLLLGGAYAGLVLGLGGLLGQDSSLVVAAATLAVAALFQPARRRIQDVVDRRFNRRRYDAVRTIEAFSDRLRQETDLDTLIDELLSVVDQTMQPTRVSCWVRRAPAGQGTDQATRRPGAGTR
jgi:hypothetical protein